MQHDEEKTLVIVIQASGFLGLLYGNVLAIQRPSGMVHMKVPALGEAFCERPPFVWCGWHLEYFVIVLCTHDIADLGYAEGEYVVSHPEGEGQGMMGRARRQEPQSDG